MAAKSTKCARVSARAPKAPAPIGANLRSAGYSGDKPSAALVIPGKDPWYRSILTDHNGDFDMGAVLVGVVAVFMCINSGYDTIILHTKFDAQAFGVGISAMLGGFGLYKWGDTLRPRGTTTTTINAASTTTTGAPMD